MPPISRTFIRKRAFVRCNKAVVKTVATVWGTWTTDAQGHFQAAVAADFGNVKALLANDGQQLYSLLGSYEKMKVVGYKQTVFLQNTDDLVEDNAKAVQLYHAYDPDNNNSKNLAAIRSRPDVKITLMRPYQKKSFYVRPIFAVTPTMGNVSGIRSVDNTWIDCNMLINTAAYNNTKSINAIQVCVEGTANRTLVVQSKYYVLFKGLKNTSI